MSLAMCGKPAINEEAILLYRFHNDIFINPSFARMFSSPHQRGVTSKTPRNPRPLEGRGRGQKYLKLYELATEGGWE
jgi:hypothetical protein